MGEIGQDPFKRKRGRLDILGKLASQPADLNNPERVQQLYDTAEKKAAEEQEKEAKKREASDRKRRRLEEKKQKEDKQVQEAHKHSPLVAIMVGVGGWLPPEHNGLFLLSKKLIQQFLSAHDHHCSKEKWKDFLSSRGLPQGQSIARSTPEVLVDFVVYADTNLDETQEAWAPPPMTVKVAKATPIGESDRNNGDAVEEVVETDKDEPGGDESSGDEDEGVGMYMF